MLQSWVCTLFASHAMPCHPTPSRHPAPSHLFETHNMGSDTKPTAPQMPSCENCGVPAQLQCGMCVELFFCDTPACYDACHPRPRDREAHRASVTAYGTSSKCVQHTSQELSRVCEDPACGDALICMHCAYFEHAGHKTVDVTDYMKRQRDTLRSHVADLTAQQTAAEEDLKTFVAKVGHMIAECEAVCQLGDDQVLRAVTESQAVVRSINSIAASGDRHRLVGAADPHTTFSQKLPVSNVHDALTQMLAFAVPVLVQGLDGVEHEIEVSADDTGRDLLRKVGSAVGLPEGCFDMSFRCEVVAEGEDVAQLRSHRVVVTQTDAQRAKCAAVADATADATNHHIKHNRKKHKKKNRPRNDMMDVTFVLEDSGVTATVEVPCEANVAAAKEVACTALAVSPACVEMRIGTQVLEETCRLQDTAFDAGVQVVLARRFADIECPAEYYLPDFMNDEYGESFPVSRRLPLSHCGRLCVYQGGIHNINIGGFDTETLETLFSFKVYAEMTGVAAISQCKTRCYLPSHDCLRKVALPGGEVLRTVDRYTGGVFACGSVVINLEYEQGVISVYDEDLTLLRSLKHAQYGDVAVSDCGRWVISASGKDNKARLWDVNTGKLVTRVPSGSSVALSPSASVFAVGDGNYVRLYNWSGAALRSVDVDGDVYGVQFTPCGKYLVARACADTEDDDYGDYGGALHQYDVATMSCVRVIPESAGSSFVISPCSRVVLVRAEHDIVTRHLYPHNSE